VKFLLATIIGLTWSSAYVLIIWRGFADRTYGMPIVAAGCNVSWEFIFTFVHPLPGLERIISATWLVLDIVIVATIVRFGPAEFSFAPRWAVLAGLALITVAAYLATLLIADHFDMARASLTAFGSNLLMSALFLNMLLSRWTNRTVRQDPLRGQSLLIAWTKMIGTACAALATYLYLFKPYSRSLVLPYLFLSVFVLDVAYIVALYLARAGRLSRPHPSPIPAPEPGQDPSADPRSATPRARSCRPGADSASPVTAE
jgi:hypothetical protein